MGTANNTYDGDVSYATDRRELSKKTDLRVIRTRRSLWEALVKLVEKRSLDEITVGEITRNAMVNRATFYRHYEDKSDLLERGTAEILTDLAARIRPAAAGVDTRDFDSARYGLKIVLDHIADHAEFYRIMLISDSGWGVRAGIQDVISSFLMQKILSAHVVDRPSLVPDNVTTRVVTAMIVGLVTWWIEQRQPVSKEDLIEYYIKLTVLGPYRCLGFDAESVAQAAKNLHPSADQVAR